MNTTRTFTRRSPRLLALTAALALSALALAGCEKKADDANEATAENTAGTESSEGTPGEPGDEGAGTAATDGEALQIVEADASKLLADVAEPGAKATLVNVWATWCAPCVEEFPELVKLSREYADKGLRVRFVSTDQASERPKVEAFLQEQGVTGPSYMVTGDEEAFINGIEPEWDGALPVTLVYDATGKKVHFHAGPGDYAKFASLVDPVLAGKAAPAQAPDEKLALGGTMPRTDVKMKNVDSSEVTLADVRGDKGTLVIFTCNHCPYAKAWAERIAEIGNTYDDKGIGVIAINPNDPVAYPDDDFAAMQTEAKTRGFEFPYVVDGDSSVARAFGATKTPHVYLFDANDKLVYVGAIDDNHEDASAVTQHWLRDALDAVIAGNPVPTAESKALGCSIKWRETAEATPETSP